MVNQLATMNIVLEDKLQVLLLLSSLMDDYETSIVTLTSLAPNGVSTISIIKTSLFENETRGKNVDSP